MSTETEQFLKDLEPDQKSILDTPLTPETPALEKEEEDTEFKAKNRRERRLLEQNQRLREETIATNARLEALAEAKQLRESEEPKEYLKRLEKIYSKLDTLGWKASRSATPPALRIVVMPHVTRSVLDEFLPVLEHVLRESGEI